MGVNATALAEPLLDAIDRLDWLCPSSESLVSLAEPSPVAEPFDPAIRLLRLRHDNLAAALEFALSRLSNPHLPFPDPARPACALALRASRTLARLAAELASDDPATAQIAETLAGLVPVGWLAVCALRPDLADQCLHQSTGDPILQQRLCWGVDHVAIARRVARRWQLPDWLAVSLAYPTLPAQTLIRLAGMVPPEWSAALAAARLAVALLPAPFAALGLVHAQPLDQLLHACHREASETHTLAQRLSDELAPAPPATPALANPLLLPLLRAVANRQQQATRRTLAQVERELDTLTELYVQQQIDAARLLQEEKLAALAEFAAGAGHEINNPLAVISGHAQYLAQRETDPQRQKTLAAIMRQTRRIHDVLTGLMQFARPTTPRLTMDDLRGVVEEVVDHLKLECSSTSDEPTLLLTTDLPTQPILLPMDRAQISQAVTALIRNAIQAVGKAGWVRVRLTQHRGEAVVSVEDSGPGLTAQQRRHLFDPFYSGRDAGRGRGLGLPIAWRIAQGHGGTVSYRVNPGEPTCFLLTLPLPVADRCCERTCA